jgi:hypothetical protein
VADLYARGLLSLCDEQNPGRRDSGAVGSLPPAARLTACRRVAAVSVFGGRPVVWTGPAVPGEGDTGVIADDCCCGGTERWDELKVELTPEAVREALRTGLFTGRGAQQLIGSIRAQQASERSEGYADRGVMPENYYAGHARHQRLANPEVPGLVYARRNPGRSAPLNGHGPTRQSWTSGSLQKRSLTAAQAGCGCSMITLA